jgi:hypothetical protein
MAGTRVDAIASDLRRGEGVALLFDASRASVFDTTTADSVIGLGAQGGSEVDLQAERPQDPPALHVVVGTSTRFVGNQSRLGSGTYPLPLPFCGQNDAGCE